MTWERILKDEEEELKNLKEDIQDIIDQIEELYEKRDDIRYNLKYNSLDDMLPAEDIKEAVEGLRSVFIGLRLNWHKQEKGYSMSWENILKREEFKVFEGSPPAFMVSLMSNQKNRDRIKGSVLKIYGDDNYLDMVDLKEISINDFLKSEQFTSLMDMDRIVVVVRKRDRYFKGWLLWLGKIY